MRHRYLILVIIACFSLLGHLSAQVDLAQWSGKIFLDGEPAIGATVQVISIDRYAVAEENGEYEMADIPFGTYQVVVSYVGAKEILEIVKIDRSEISLDFRLNTSSEVLSEVTVSAQSINTEIESRPIAINSLNARALNNQALGAEQLLRRSAGVIVRQQGGLGSQTSINLNGLTGAAVRVYYDGIPLQVYGGGVQLNNIPIDALERVEVYKGVLPVNVGTDALGGAINLVPYQAYQNNLRASYSIGSFNTHRVTLGGRKNFNEHISVSLLSFLNYSDNDYLMRDIPNLNEVIQENGTILFEEERIDVRRFHNQHFSAFVDAELAIRNLPWADRLTISSFYNRRFDEIQHGRIIQNLAVGEATNEIQSFSQRIDYRKKFLNDKMRMRYFGVLSYTTTVANDSTTAVYNWKGETFTEITNALGAELFATPTQRVGQNVGTAHRLFLEFELSEYLDLAISNFYRYTTIVGEDPAGRLLDLEQGPIDPNTVPSVLSRNVFGAELKSTFWKNRLTAVGFYKNYQYSAESIDIIQRNATVLPIRSLEDNQHGFGFALKYQITPTTYLRGSFEQATRIPTENEIFGDFGAILPNYTLRPENSDNWNLGVAYSKLWKGQRRINVQLNGFIRNRENLIRIAQFGPENAVFVNEDKVDGMGLEFSSRVNPIDHLSVDFNLTYQSNEIVPNPGSTTTLEGIQVPNIPSYFYNVGAAYRLEKIFRSESDLELFWNFFFIDRFSINEVKDLDTANPSFVIPRQYMHNTGFVYAPNISGLKFSLTIQNVFNAMIFDNFRVPRPGINFAFKINYSI